MHKIIFSYSQARMSPRFFWESGRISMAFRHEYIEGGGGQLETHGSRIPLNVI